MLGNLKFVQGAIKKNLIAPELEYYQIKDGRIVGYNGFMALSAPIDLSIEAMPKADLFYKALAACGDNITINQTPSGRLHVQSGAFSVYINCTEREVYQAAPAGVLYDAPEGLCRDFGKLLPFISEDASRRWSMGLSVANGAYMATNNILLVQMWAGHDLPSFNCPAFAVAEVVRVKQDPVKIQIEEGVSVTFHYSDGRWIKTQLLAQDWPVDKMASILDRPTVPKHVPDDFHNAVATLDQFAGLPSAPIYFKDGAMTTGAEGSEEGATVAVEGLEGGPIFSIKSLKLLSTVVEKVDFSMFPTPCIFYGERMRGAIIGMNL